jgi:hypothetical protein
MVINDLPTNSTDAPGIFSKAASTKGVGEMTCRCGARHPNLKYPLIFIKK